MDYLETTDWPNTIRNNAKQVEVDLQEVERVLSLARRTPGLRDYEDELQRISIFFHAATRHYQQTTPGNLVSLVEWWERYRAAIVQRYAGLTDPTLRSADKIVASVFDSFLAAVPSENIAYSPDAKPLVYGGEGGTYGYFTHPPGWNRPFAIINLPHTAFDIVWQWLALPHEVGHDIYATVEGLPAELESAMASRMREAVENREVQMPAIDVDLSSYGINHRIRYSPSDLLAAIWQAWANEAQADAIGLLSCGGAALVSLQYIVGFSPNDHWQLLPLGGGDFSDKPEEHPTSYIRNAFNLAVLRLLGPEHHKLADEIEARFVALRPDADKIRWRLGDSVVVAEIPVSDMVRSAQIAAEVIVNKKLKSLGNKSYSDVIRFDADDQKKVDSMVGPLLAGDPTFADGATARHALAATLFAFERNPAAADVITRTFRHFV